MLKYNVVVFNEKNKVKGGLNTNNRRKWLSFLVKNRANKVSTLEDLKHIKPKR